MISKKDYERMQYLQKNDEETYHMIRRIIDSNAQELSAASHNIKNYISFIRSSYQIITEHHPEVNDFPFWKEMHDAVNDLNNFMDQTSLYRYCEKAHLCEMNLNDLLFELPDELDAIFETEDRDYDFDIDLSEINVAADYNKLKAAFIEILKNSFEATTDNDTIEISAHKSVTDSNVKITISNHGFIDQYNTDSVENASVISWNSDLAASIDNDTICKPFYTTKNDHSGIGMSIVYRVCMTHNAALDIVQNGTNTEVSITLPLAS